ncbi:unnamed protein product [Toxocara canis]|uniref:Rad60-SLD domain-containing protein n=1 Tax=Toxocara canis TaxID=6265 RepID=A0A183VE34_TOXCA|nr:unnamed protein product [Toxocara canis]
MTMSLLCNQNKNFRQISQAVDVKVHTAQIVGSPHNTDSLPKATFTPMLRSGLHALQEADGESRLTMSTDFSTTAHVFGQAECLEMLVYDELGEASMDISGATLTFTDLKKTVAAELNNTNAKETTSMKNARALLAKSPPVSHGRLNHTSMMLTSVSSKRSEDGTVRNATMALFTRRGRDQITDEKPTGDVFRGMNNKESNLEREAAKDQRLSATTFLGVDDGNRAMSFVDESRESWVSSCLLYLWNV